MLWYHPGLPPSSLVGTKYCCLTYCFDVEPCWSLPGHSLCQRVIRIFHTFLYTVVLWQLGQLCSSCQLHKTSSPWLLNDFQMGGNHINSPVILVKCIVLWIQYVRERENRRTSCFPTVYKTQTCKTEYTAVHAAKIIMFVRYFSFILKWLWKQHIDLLTSLLQYKKKRSEVTKWNNLGFYNFLSFSMSDKTESPLKWFILQFAHRFTGSISGYQRDRVTTPVKAFPQCWGVYTLFQLFSQGLTFSCLCSTFNTEKVFLIRLHCWNNW